MYQHNLIPNKKTPTRIEKNSATVIDQVIRNYVLTCNFKTTILKTELTDHFPIVIALKNDGTSRQRSKTKYLS